ncbi:AEC family transporter [Chloroflexota bacterium]
MIAFSGVFGVAVNVILPIFIIIGLGALFGRQFNPDTKVISTTIIYLFSPFLVINSMMNSTIANGELFLIAGLAVTLAVIMAGLSFGVARFFRFDRRLESAFIMTVILINGGNFGLPVNEFAYGAVGLQRAMIYYVTTSLLANTFGVFLASRGKASVRQSLTNIFKVPLVYGLIVGLCRWSGLSRC